MDKSWGLGVLSLVSPPPALLCVCVVCCVLCVKSRAMDRYQKVQKPKPEVPINENEIRITAQGLVRNYISYATTLLQEKRGREIVLKAMGQAISKAVAIAEILKRRIPQLHQDTAISSVSITDVWEPIEEGLLPVEQIRHVSMISITLSTKQQNKNSPGYQAPSNVEQPRPQYSYQQQQQQQPRPARIPYNEDSYGQGGRGRGRGRGRDWSRGGYGNYQENGGYSNWGRGGGRSGRGWGNRGGGYERGRGGRYEGAGYEGGRGAGYESGRGDDGYESGRGGGGRYESGQGGGGGYESGRGGGNRGYGRGRGRMGNRPRGGGNQAY